MKNYIIAILILSIFLISGCSSYYDCREDCITLCCDSYNTNYFLNLGNCYNRNEDGETIINKPNETINYVCLNKCYLECKGEK